MNGTSTKLAMPAASSPPATTLSTSTNAVPLTQTTANLATVTSTLAASTATSTLSAVTSTLKQVIVNTTVAVVTTNATTTKLVANVTTVLNTTTVGNLTELGNTTATNGSSVAAPAVVVSPTWEAFTTYLGFVGIILPPWAIMLCVFFVVVFVFISVAICWKSWSDQPQSKASKPKSNKSVAPLDTSHLLDYPGSMYSINVQPEGSEIELEHRSNSTILREKRFLGSLKYSVQYDATKNELQVTLHQAADLHLAVPEDAVNPFCKVYLYPDKDKKARYETTIEMGSTNPVFNQTYTFNLPFSELLDKTLVLAVWNAAHPARPSIIGQVRIPVGAIDINKPIGEEWRDLEMVPEVDDDASHGDVCISLRYVPTTTKLTAVVLECKNLRRKTDAVPKPCDPFLKLKLKQNSKIIKSKRTSVKKRTFNPYYNEEFTFLITPDHLHKSQLIITAYVYEAVVGGRKIGKIVLGSNVPGSGAQHWNEMVSSPRKSIVQWHRLETM